MAIRQYMEALPAKVDRVAAVLRYFDEQVEWADREIKRLRTRKSAIEENADRLKDCVAAVLEKQPLPAKGCRKLAGQHSTLMLKGNGGVAPLVISQPELIPDELCEWTGKLPNRVYVMLMRAPMPFPMVEEIARSFTRVPSNTLVREALIQPCAACDGSGRTRVALCDIPGSVLNNGHTEMEQWCPACAGTGRASVPGAHLGERAFHVEVR